MSIYSGLVTPDGRFIVMKNGRHLTSYKSQRLRNHSPCGFAWGYCGSGPAQLALAILLEETTKVEALDFYQRFKFSVVAGWDKHLCGAWKIESKEIQAWLADHRAMEGFADAN